MTKKNPKWKETEEIHEKILTDEALKAFKFTYDDIKNDKVCNKKSIKKRYKGLAKTFHPDMGGKAAQFQEIHAHYGILLAMVEPNDNGNGNRKDKRADQKQHRDVAEKLVKAIMWPDCDN